jgi:hypothetical protein
VNYEDDWFRTFGTGMYGGLDERYPRKRRKGPLGFTKLDTKRKPRPRRKTRGR